MDGTDGVAHQLAGLPDSARTVLACLGARAREHDGMWTTQTSARAIASETGIPWRVVVRALRRLDEERLIGGDPGHIAHDDEGYAALRYTLAAHLKATLDHGAE
jgi:hypothetical protein